MSLTKKFVLTFLLVTLLPLGLIIWVSHQTLVDQAQQQIGARLEDSVAQVGKSIDAYMLNCISNISTLAANPDLGLGDYKLIGEHLSRAAFSKSCFEQVMFVDTQGDVRISKESETETRARLHFRIEDSGIGVSSEAQGKLFEAFSQADGSTTRKFGGTGLGLAIAKQLATMMDGEIGMQSELGKGSAFWFTAELEKQAGTSRDPYPSSHDLVGMRVLAVDDNATNRQIVRHQLDAWKMDVETAADGKEALKMMRDAVAREEPYRLALLDVQMPEMDGWTLARAIQADPALRGTRLIVLTSFRQSFSIAELKAAGIEAYLVKPVKQSHLLDCLVSAMGKAVVKSSESSLPLEEMRILVAEDNNTNRKVALGRLQKLRYRADSVANGLEVLEALRHFPYDLILMDCQMPEMDGYEATQAIREWERSVEHACPWNAPIYIIALTAHAMEGDREKCLAVGMDDYLSKPMQVPELQAALERGKRAIQRPVKWATTSES